MAQDDSYEIIPHQLLSDLKAEVSVLKEKLMGPDAVTAELIESMQQLQKSIDTLHNIFSDVQTDLKSEPGNDPHKEILDALNKVTDQNEQIARGMVAIADMVEKHLRRPAPMPTAHPPPRPPIARVMPPQPRPGQPPSSRPPMNPPQPPRPSAPPMPPPRTPSPPHPDSPFAKVEGGMPPPPPPPPDKKKSSFISKIFHKK